LHLLLDCVLPIVEHTADEARNLNDDVRAHMPVIDALLSARTLTALLHAFYSAGCVMRRNDVRECASDACSRSTMRVGGLVVDVVHRLLLARCHFTQPFNALVSARECLHAMCDFVCVCVCVWMCARTAADVATVRDGGRSARADRARRARRRRRAAYGVQVREC
jgi:hypothetical protein